MPPRTDRASGWASATRCSTSARGAEPPIRVYINGLQEAALEDSTHQGQGGISVGGIGVAVVGGELDWRIDMRLDNLLVIRR